MWLIQQVGEGLENMACEFVCTGLAMWGGQNMRAPIYISMDISVNNTSACTRIHLPAHTFVIRR